MEIILIIIGLAFTFSLADLLNRADKPWWGIFIPIYNYWLLFETADLPGWLAFLMFIPMLNIILAMLLFFNLGRVFGQSALFSIGMVILPFIFVPMLSMSSPVYDWGYEYDEYGKPKNDFKRKNGFDDPRLTNDMQYLANSRDRTLNNYEYTNR